MQKMAISGKTQAGNSWEFWPKKLEKMGIYVWRKRAFQIFVASWPVTSRFVWSCWFWSQLQRTWDKDCFCHTQVCQKKKKKKYLLKADPPLDLTPPHPLGCPPDWGPPLPGLGVRGLHTDDDDDTYHDSTGRPGLQSRLKTSEKKLLMFRLWRGGGNSHLVAPENIFLSFCYPPPNRTHGESKCLIYLYTSCRLILLDNYL